jgi:F0F1-type ATP synthase beta subunit
MGNPSGARRGLGDGGGAGVGNPVVTIQELAGNVNQKPTHAKGDQSGYEDDGTGERVTCMREGEKLMIRGV